MNTDPLISVILPVYNGMPYLPEAVESILAQTFRRFEFLIIDDGSTDDTPRYLASLTDPRVRLYRLSKAGMVRALNFGLDAARTSVVARMDADDISVPTRFEKQYGYLQAHPDCVLLSCHFEYMSPEGSFIREHRNLVSDEAIRWQMLFTTPFVHPGAMFSRAAAAAVGNYDLVYPTAQDYELWTRLSGRGKLANFPESLLRYRYNPVSVSMTNSLAQREAASRIAGAYAAAVVPGVTATHGRELYTFLATGEWPASGDLGGLVRTFRRMKDYLGGTVTSVPELRDHVRSTQQQLRWRCTAECLQNAWRPVTALRWLRQARAFDPEGTTVAAMLRRRFRRRALPTTS
jgi:hypothetical protein